MLRLLAAATLGAALALAGPALAEPSAGPAISRGEAAVEGASGVTMMGAGMRASDLERSIRFYTEGLGMELRGKVEMGPMTEVILGFRDAPEGATILIYKTGDDARPVDHGDASAKILLSVADLAAVMDRLEAAGYEAGELHDNGPYKIAMIYDPDGYRFEVVQLPAAAAEH